MNTTIILLGGIVGGMVALWLYYFVKGVISGYIEAEVNRKLDEHYQEETEAIERAAKEFNKQAVWRAVQEQIHAERSDQRWMQ